MRTQKLAILAAALVLSVMIISISAQAGEIHDAAKAGDTVKIVSILEASPDAINSKDDGGSTPLDVAAMNGKIEAAKLLIDKGADVDSKDNDLWTPLHEAIANHHKDVVELFITKGANIRAKTKNEYTPLHQAAWSGEKEIADLLLSKGAEVDIFIASSLGMLSKVEAFVKEDSDLLKAKDGYGETPLHHAAWNNQRAVALFLLAKDADTAAKTNSGATPLHRAATNGSKSVAELLLVEGADTGAKDDDGDTPLHRAACYGEVAVIDLLIAKGAAVGVENNEEETPLYLAAEMGQKEALVLLCKHASDSVQAAAILMAAESGESAAVKLLLAVKPGLVNAEDAEYYSPLHLAAGIGSLETAKVLVAGGADVNALSDYLETPLDIALWEGYTEVADWLRSQGGEEGDSDY